MILVQLCLVPPAVLCSDLSSNSNFYFLVVKFWVHGADKDRNERSASD